MNAIARSSSGRSARRRRRRLERQAAGGDKPAGTPRGEGARQVAALACVRTRGAIEVLLISSRRRARWIIPKGWPHGGRSLAQSAAIEAFEEAGVDGPVHPDPIGQFNYVKQLDGARDIACSVLVYPLLVLEHRLEWPEKSERRLAWYEIGEAAALVDDEELGLLLGQLARRGDERLTRMLGALA